jgi:hypothetical protein
MRTAIQTIFWLLVIVLVANIAALLGMIFMNPIVFTVTCVLFIVFVVLVNKEMKR